MIEVIQVDREAAAELSSYLKDYNRRGVLALGGDHNPITQKCAAMRLAAENAGMQAMKEAAALMARSSFANTEAKIRALAPDEIRKGIRYEQT